jgi:hypothetical protein
MYLQNYSESELETWKKPSLLYPIQVIQASDLESFPKKNGRENSKITSLDYTNPRIVLL